MNKKRDSLRYLKKGGWRALLGPAALAVAAALLLAANSLGGELLRRDITPGRIYTLSQATLDTLSRLDADVELLAVSDGAPDAGLAELLGRYAAASPRVHTGAVTTAASAYYMGAAQGEGSVIVSCGASSEAHDAASLTERVYEGRELVDERYCAERLITGSIAYVTAELPLACVMSDHGEAPLDPGFLALLRERGFHTRDIYLTEKNELPARCALVVCNAPMADLGGEEADTLISFLEGGGAMLMVTGSQNVGALANLGCVAAAAGMEAVPGVVLETDARRVYSAEYPYFLLPAPVEGELTAPLAEAGVPVLMSQAHGIQGAGGGSGFLSLLETTDASYVKPDAYADGNLAFAPGDRVGPFSVAAAGMTVGGGKLLWVASSQCLLDAVDAMVAGANYRLAGSALAWMGAAEPLEAPAIEARSVLESGPDAARAPLFTALLAAAPLLPLAAGLAAAARRRRAARRA